MHRYHNHYNRKWLFSIVSLSLLALTCALSGCGSVTAAKPEVRIVSTPTPKPTSIPTPTPTSIPTPTPTPTVANPMHLSIPAISVDAAVEQVGLLADGSLATPVQNEWTSVGWFQFGPRPGELGSAVIDGHLDDHSSAPAVFWNLQKLHAGDDVFVADASGRSIHFRVTRVVGYTPDQAPLQEIFGNQDGTYLNLITCVGDWLPGKQQFSQRLVVYTSMV